MWGTNKKNNSIHIYKSTKTIMNPSAITRLKDIIERIKENPLDNKQNMYTKICLWSTVVIKKKDSI